MYAIRSYYGSQLVTNWTKLESSNIYVHDNWPFYFGRWNATLKNGDLQAQFTNEMSNDTSTSFALNQIFVDTNLIMEVARLENMVEGSFYIDPRITSYNVCYTKLLRRSKGKMFDGLYEMYPKKPTCMFFVKNLSRVES